ncbi:hypothetical protein DL89DRAFT_269936 [Linderina pennispora]|uniref:F-box domain-containing protein n=1 Tax=Linderina pennispora TaxID=61395 RepID=A0A1Y1W088_9FUNG|nr:uncharacterized protein DL89DRAFT_269936 [Linderina pennispora]ORX66902.1 hypothetical protein DL89DRAFT_269936 [Linderina pennispora]
MDSTVFPVQNVPPDILYPIFDCVEYGRKLKNEWEKLGHKKVADGTKSLLSIAQVCHSWRTAALPYFYQSTETLLGPVLDVSDYCPEMDCPNLFMAAAAGHSQLVRSAHFYLSLDRIIDGISTRLLSAGALSTATFPNVTEIVLYFYSSKIFFNGDYSAKVGRFIERTRQLFPNAQDCSLTVHSGLWIGKGDMYRDLMGILFPTPRTLIFRDLANANAVLHGGFSAGIQRVYLEIGHSFECPIVHSNRDTIEELVLHISLDLSPWQAEGDISDDLESLFCNTYPELTSLSIETGPHVVGNFHMPDVNPFPLLTSLSLNTRCDIDIGVVADDCGENLTSLTMHLTVPIFRSLRGRVFPNLKYVRIRSTDFSAASNAIGNVIEVTYMPFLVAPNAEYIENCYSLLSFGRSLPSIIPPNHSNPHLRHLIIRNIIPTLSVFQQVLAHFPGLIRIGIDGIGSDEGDSLDRSDGEISRLMAELPIFSARLRRVDLNTLLPVKPQLVVAISRLPSLRMVTIRNVTGMLSQYKEEIGKSVYDEYRDSLSRPLFCTNGRQ